MLAQHCLVSATKCRALLEKRGCNCMLWFLVSEHTGFVLWFEITNITYMHWLERYHALFSCANSHYLWMMRCNHIGYKVTLHLLVQIHIFICSCCVITLVTGMPHTLMLYLLVEIQTCFGWCYVITLVTGIFHAIVFWTRVVVNALFCKCHVITLVTKVVGTFML